MRPRLPVPSRGSTSPAMFASLAVALGSLGATSVSSTASLVGAGLLVAAASLVILAPAPARAADAPPPPMGVWTGKGQLGFLDSQGNTEAASGNAALEAGLLEGLWKHALHLDWLYGKSAGVVAAERWDAQWQSNYNFTANLFTFGLLTYQHDLFSGFQYQGSATAGIGYQIFNTAVTKLSVQVGAGYRKERPEDLIKNSAGQVVGRIPLSSNSNVIATGGLNYTQQLTSTTSLSDTALLEAGADDTMVTDTLALAVKVSDKIALGVGFNLQDNTNPPAGLKNLDTTETVNLVYSF
jgi:putative salt-induced outer membrane protein